MNDRDNATPAIVARDETVVVTWSAAVPEGGTDIFAAVSEDGGVTFRAPVRVNDLELQARANGEQPPRPAIGPREIAVVWNTRRDGLSEVRISRSIDGGRTFGASAPVHPPGLTGARGWTAVAADASGAFDVAWLDGRNAVAKPAAAPAAAPATKSTGPSVHHNHGGAPRQDLYHARFAPDGTRTETQVATNVCFCCKAAIVTEADGQSSIAWRHIYPNSMRDIAFRTIGGSAAPSDAVRISEDQWQLAGCPDDGPAMVKEDAGRIHVVWPTLVKGDTPSKGIFYATTDDRRVFSARLRLDDGTSKAASHPQLARIGANGLAIVWDEPSEGTRRVLLRHRLNGSAQWSPIEALPDEAPAYYPAAAAVRDGLLAVWTSATTPRSTIVVYRRPIAPSQ